ncbi:putative capsular associated protein [Aspergillus aculeatinus CBS 121060]|uniref:Uncharacterized protein n=1 Tax=Aspergillus aculeatinus CBS 121060 TaxID=1448322 RepID=A0ACD1HAY4_9EURO|nr:hypothetical protein BO66DRAFT_348829 [Aspergillus aculeatinus CBS 121060]RAH70733.1 hypothetical protein BO66DRAFT_348829 [Aspergillus aculeatinus CBS 121060]
MVHFSAETGLKASVGIFLLSCTFLATSYNTTFAFDHPLNTAVITCFIAASSLLILSRFINRIPIPSSSVHKYSVIPLTEREQAIDEPSSPISLESSSSSITPSKTRNLARWFKIGLVSVLGCARVGLYRQVTANIECAPDGYAYAIPFFIAIYDYWRNQRGRSATKWTAPDGPQNAQLRMVATIASRIHYFVFRSQLRYVASAASLLASGYLAVAFDQGRESTYICATVSGQYPRLHTLRVLSAIFDSMILIGAAELSSEGARPRDGRRKQTLVSWGFSLLGVAAFWGAIIAYITVRSHGSDDFVNPHFLRSAIGQGALVACVIVSASQLIPHYGVVGLSVLAGFVSLYYTWTATLFDGHQPFPLVTAPRAFAALLLNYLGGLSFLYARTVSEEEPQFLYRFNITLRVALTVMAGIGFIFVTQQGSVAHLHPIDLLIYEGRQHHDKWLHRANSSQTLADAVAQYRLQYNQHPPPNFDKWYEFAMNKSSLVIDDFDEIHNNLLPFRSVSPAAIRDMTQKLATNPYNEIGAISIRNGTARVQEGIKPTHAWMVISAAKMIEKFAEHLPDMDLAFNLNDEPRVAVPWEEMSALKDQALSHPVLQDERIQNEWSTGRSDQWLPIEPADQTHDTMFVDSSFKNIFDRYVSATCPPSSKARSQRIWDRRHLCISCIRPHSLGEFPSDWALATDICHQPDLAHLHGFFMSPASFKVSQELIPVFSQSAIAGFGDIIFPSPWNYVDKIEYKPSTDYPDANYADKSNTLFWIGSTSEGISHSGEWKGMPRQRLTHLINNNTHNHVSVFLPTADNTTDSYRYQILPGTSPSSSLHLDTAVQILDPIVRCRHQDCEDQTAEFGLAGRVDFQAHWQNRYLFDADGAGFSGRFLPFMQSHSLPFKTGLFRQWFETRITPWLHFVPVDVRLHGLWSTLAYFSGVESSDHTSTPEKRALLKPHDIEGQWIAEEGRKWAAQVLRKEDMEVYFFRLLLEWGRLTDDRREELGYKL